MLKKILFALVCAVIGTSYAQLSEADNKAAVDKMKALVTDVEDKILKRDIPQDEKNKHFDEILVSQMDLEKVSSFIVGKPWKEANSADKDKFLKSFRHFQILRFKETFNSYSDEVIEVGGTLPSSSKNQLFVEMQIKSKSKQGEPIDIKWKMAKENNGDFKITDVVIEGVSMAASLKQEYSAILNNATGNKLEYLAKKIDAKAKEFEKPKKK